MQFYLTFQTDRLTLPLAYQHQVQSMLYAVLRRDAGYGVTVHPGGQRDGDSPYTAFCFGSLTGESGVDLRRKEITFFRQVSLEVRTPDPQLAEALRRGLLPGSTLTLCQQPLRLERVEITERELAQNVCRIRMDSAMLAYERTADKKTIHYNPLSSEFEPLIQRNFQRKYQRLTGQEPGVLQCKPLSVGYQDKVVTNYKGTWMTGWKGEYLLKGRSEELTFLYNAGLGLRNAAGFGLFHVVE